ncbi:MAG TPA: PspC domain-containing protein [Acidimicrobiales bacterium]
MATTPLTRRRQGRVIGGVASGLARAWRIDPTVMRFGFLLLALAGGAGVVLYVALWLIVPASDETGPVLESSRRDDLAALAVIIGTTLLLRAAGIWFSDAITLIGGVAAGGIALLWGRADTAHAPVRRTGGGLRIAVGMVLVATGFVAFVVLTADLRAIGQSLVAVAVATAGIALLAAPRLTRLADDLTAERRARVRSEERAEIAAHLHDGVLQTLALIQRRAGDNREVAALARRQERELREWLYGDPAPSDATLASSVRTAMADVEDTHQVRIEVVCVGDAPLGDDEQSLVAAVREAATNAARHAGVDTLDVYVEVDDEALLAFVRDRGRGFDPELVPSDRRGLAESIKGRLDRAGGTAEIRSTPGDGTEVALRIPRRPA